jgi:DNA (cytosine-5)-methyltransferase 1
MSIPNIVISKSATQGTDKLPESVQVSMTAKSPAKPPLIFTKTKVNEKFIDISDSDHVSLSNNKVVSLFSGAGGLDIGLEWAGFDTAVCVEIDVDCRETLRVNRPQWKLFENADGRIPGDIRSISAKELMEFAGLKKGEAALVAGGAPCQSFSNIGKKEGINCPENGNLFLEFLRIVKDVSPSAVLFENVTGITQEKHTEVIKQMRTLLEDAGYGVAHTVLNSANYGVAQRRERFFLLGIKSKRVISPAFPLPTHYKSLDDWKSFTADFDSVPVTLPASWVTLREALSRIPKNSAQRSDYALMNISDVVRERMKHIPPGKNFHVLPMEMRPNCWKHGRHKGLDTFGRLKLDEPSVTIRTAAYNPMKGKYIHPSSDRGLSTHEMAAIQDFPYSWEFKSASRERITLVSGGRQIGNAVPPSLAHALGLAIKLQIAD